MTCYSVFIKIYYAFLVFHHAIYYAVNQSGSSTSAVSMVVLYWSHKRRKIENYREDMLTCLCSALLISFKVELMSTHASTLHRHKYEHPYFST